MVKQIRTHRLLVTDVKQSIQLERLILKYPIDSKLTFKVSIDLEHVTHVHVHCVRCYCVWECRWRCGVAVREFPLTGNTVTTRTFFKISVVFCDQLSVHECTCPGRLFLLWDQIGELTVSGLNGLESWHLNIQSEGAVCMKAARVMYWSSAARCEANVALS